jgi:arylsulfatase A-like enzyme
MPYDRSRGWFDSEADFPGPRTMATAARWLRRDAPHHDRFFLFVDEFDPHEPFDTPSSYVHRFDPDWDGPPLIWPPYKVGAVAEGVLTEREAHHIRCRYGAKLAMIDHWFGEVLDSMDAAGLWESTAVIVTTDHGHYLGEKDTFGKPASPIYDALGHIPLLVAWPGVEPGVRTALSTNVDVHATVAAAFGVEQTPIQHGVSLVPSVLDPTAATRDHVLFGYWGREVGILGDGMKYIRSPEQANAPLTMYSNRLSTMPIASLPQLRMPKPKADAELVPYPGTDVPVIKQTFAADDLKPFWAYGTFTGSQLFDRGDDPTEDHNLVGRSEEAGMEERLRIALADIGAPDDQLVRLGLTKS